MVCYFNFPLLINLYFMYSPFYFEYPSIITSYNRFGIDLNDRFLRIQCQQDFFNCWREERTGQTSPIQSMHPYTCQIHHHSFVPMLHWVVTRVITNNPRHLVHCFCRRYSRAQIYSKNATRTVDGIAVPAVIQCHSHQANDKDGEKQKWKRRGVRRRGEKQHRAWFRAL